jgi:hypothetical protein
MILRYLLAALVALLMATGADAKGSQREQKKIYIFGMAASFTDTIVHFTSIQEVDSAWLDKKRGFLVGRDSYSSQLREYLYGQLQLMSRTCLVIYDTKRKKLEKKYDNMMRLYATPTKGSRQYDVRHIDQQDFLFQRVEMNEDSEVEELPDEENADGKEAKKKDKKPRKGDKGNRPAPPPGMDGTERRMPRG